MVSSCLELLSACRKIQWLPGHGECNYRNVARTLGLSFIIIPIFVWCLPRTMCWGDHMSGAFLPAIPYRLDKRPSPIFKFVLYICGTPIHSFAKAFLSTSSLWDQRRIRVLFYSCQEIDSKFCMSLTDAHKYLECRQSIYSTTQLAKTQIITDIIREEIDAEIESRVFFTDADILYQGNLLDVLERHHLFDIAVSNESGNERVKKANIGALLIRPSTITLQFWHAVMQEVKLGKWDQKSVDELLTKWQWNMTVSFFQKREIYAFGFGFPINRSSSVYSHIDALHAVCMGGFTLKEYFSKELGFWPNADAYYSIGKIVRVTFDNELPLSLIVAQLNIAVEFAHHCDIAFIPPMIIKQNLYYEVIDIPRISEYVTFLEPSYLKNRMKYDQNKLQIKDVKLSEVRNHGASCPDLSINLVLDDGFSAANLGSDKDIVQGLLCLDSSNRIRIRCQIPETNHTLCMH